ncbi:hypothetical protein Tcan_11917 [Toxocara canis]|uniref:Activin_recp domain-containing protein n=1 Tax=Toxocara canis TaxID=6265 RepID=A0A0B2VCP7_TOXCA|nr:hypothetical protein Tcan_11917 [Toxocara canis]
MSGFEEGSPFQSKPKFYARQCESEFHFCYKEYKEEGAYYTIQRGCAMSGWCANRTGCRYNRLEMTEFCCCMVNRCNSEERHKPPSMTTAMAAFFAMVVPVLLY